uniref:NitT/TauT family transport system ATP-binding protein n=1 Tax=Candidatus Kentrum sp. LPFa TaxID=2126335 RepID=A0A450WBJ0_9GAMM|nr:MAG: NitT/TauT family transport system ATP-binding protein [Candidatus Kentron sp. LPFa]
MIRLVNVGKRYNSRGGEINALSGISLDISEREFVSIIGPSGCGKTTLLKIVGDLIDPTEGEVLVGNLTAEQARKKGKFSFVFQNPILLPWRRIIDNIHLPLEIMHRGTREPQELLRIVGLEDFGNKYPNELSGGMQQRVALARALTFDSQVLLMDEPFGALDEFTRNELHNLFLDIWEKIGVTVLFVTHNITEAVFLSDKIVVLSKRPACIQNIIPIHFVRPRKFGYQRN